MDLLYKLVDRGGFKWRCARPNLFGRRLVAAWKRLRADRVGMTCMAIVAAFLVLVLAAALDLIAADWQREVGVPDAPPSFVGPRPAEDVGAIIEP